MSDKKDDLPRDLRALCGGTEEDADGSQRTLLFPADSFVHICEVHRELEQAVADPNTPIEDLEGLRDELELVKRLQADMERRIRDHFIPRPPSSNTRGEAPDHSGIDHGAKSKMEKAIADAKAGLYDWTKMSKTLKAVRKDLAFFHRNGRMPSHGELKDLGFNDQQATDAGNWLALQADPEPNEESLFLPLHKAKQGRPKKK